MPYERFEGARLTGPDRDGVLIFKWKDDLFHGRRTIRIRLPADGLYHLMGRDGVKLDILFGTGADAGRIRLQPRQSPSRKR